MILYVDFETRSRCDLRAKGVYNYAQDASTDVLCMSYAFDDEPVKTWVPELTFPENVLNHTGQIRAHNAAFERLIFWYVLQINFKPEQFYCTAAQARANCLPGSLEDVGRALSSVMRKDHRGAQLIRLLSVPQADGSFRQDAALMAEMIAYCEQDVLAMRAVSKGMRDLSADELADYQTNERINDRGVLVDVPLCLAAVRYSEAEVEEIQAKVVEATDGEIRSVRSPKMREWVLARVGEQAKKLMWTGEKYSIDKTVRANLLAMDNAEEVPPHVQEVIQCADDLWASSVAKFSRLAALADDEDHRVRGAFVFAGGSATGRACVAADTLVETEDGRAPICTLRIGENVLSHTGKLCRVSGKVYKGIETMYRVTTRSGGWVECTADHQLLTNLGWAKHERKFEGVTRPGYTVGSCAAIYDPALFTGHRNRYGNRNESSHGLPNLAGGFAAGKVKDIAISEPSPFQVSGKESNVWGTQTSGSDSSSRVSLLMDERDGNICAGTSAGFDAGDGSDGLAGGVGSASYRFRYTEQQPKQPSYSDQEWASATAFSEIAEIVCVGEKGVWDITVEGDASYCAQGLIHHNSSYGAQVHNFTRKCAAEPDRVRERMVSGGAVVPEFGKRVTDVLKAMLRPAIIPAEGKVLIVADWAGIEARVNPWASNCRAGTAKLELFERGEDVYKVNASATFHVPYDQIDKEQRQIGKVQELACLSEDTLVLTACGEKPIQKVLPGDFVWDGIEWVRTDGPIYKGERYVIEYDGLCATPDHLVWVDGQTNPIELGRAAADGLRLARAGAWVKTSLPFNSETIKRSETKMHESKIARLFNVWRKRHSIRIQHNVRCVCLGVGEFRASSAGNGIRQNRQHQRICAGQSALVNQGTKPQAYLKNSKYCGVPSVPTVVSSSQIRGQHTEKFAVDEVVLRTDSRSMGAPQLQTKRRVWDLLNCGQLHRFTASGRLVHNCGFAGGVGAFAAMGRIYGVHLPESDARRMVDGWRRANAWAVPYWQDLEEAYTRAMRNKGHEFSAGRVTYLFDGTHLWYALPSGRVLCYPFARNEADGVTYAKAAWKPTADAKEWPRARLWKGLACENITQAIANDLLRHALRQVDAVLHVHDEIVLEVDATAADSAMDQLAEMMKTPPVWAKGLPLDVEVKKMPRYGK